MSEKGIFRKVKTNGVFLLDENGQVYFHVCGRIYPDKNMSLDVNSEKYEEEVKTLYANVGQQFSQAISDAWNKKDDTCI